MIALSKGFIVTENRQPDAWDRFIADVQRSRRDQAYHRHPDQARLHAYVSASQASTDTEPPLRQSDDLEAWLEGASGWPAPAVSLHVLTCSICRRRIELIRGKELTSTASEAASPWWKPLADGVRGVLTSPRVRWVATAGVIGIVFLSLTLSLLPGNPPGSDDAPPLPVDRHEPQMGGIG